MARAAIAERRLLNQMIARSGPRSPADVIGRLGAVQAQEYGAAKWGVALRMRDGAVDAAVERAFDEGRILRTHVMRATWHFVTPADIRWLLELTGPRVQRLMSTYNRQMELDDRTLARGVRVIARALRGRRYLTRTELAVELQRARLVISGQRLAHLMLHAELERVVCSGPRRGKKFTYALLAERAPDAPGLPREEALATLARRFFASHGPATLRDFVWWSGLPTADARRALDMIRARREDVDGLTYYTVAEAGRGTTRDRLAHLLPIYDEYLVAYRDRTAVPHAPLPVGTAPGGYVTFQHTLVVGGRVAGTWRPARTPRAVRIDVRLLRRLTRAEGSAVAEAVARYESFLGVPVEFAMA